MTRDCTEEDHLEEEYTAEAEQERTIGDQDLELDPDHNPVKLDMSEEEVYLEISVQVMV